MVNWLFFDFESLLHLFHQWEKCKNHSNVVIAVIKHLAKFQIKKLYRRKFITVFISPGPRQHFCFSTRSENAYAFSCALPVVKQLSLGSI